MTKRTVLIVDDDPDIRSLVATKLRGIGHHVLLANNGRAGLSAAVDYRPDLVLLDVTMPGLSGWDVCEKLSTSPSTKHIPVVIISAKAQPADVEKGFSVGAKDYITKPFSPRELADRVEAIFATLTD
jgi:two-component system response regulator MtrA